MAGQWLWQIVGRPPEARRQTCRFQKEPGPASNAASIFQFPDCETINLNHPVCDTLFGSPRKQIQLDIITLVYYRGKMNPRKGSPDPIVIEEPKSV